MASAHALDVTQLAVSELVTNARTYAPGPVLIDLHIVGGLVEVVVWDSDPVLPLARAADAGRVGQHGLETVLAIAQGFEVQREPVGKRITVHITLLDDPGGNITGQYPRRSRQVDQPCGGSRRGAGRTHLPKVTRTPMAWSTRACEASACCSWRFCSRSRSSSATSSPPDNVAGCGPGNGREVIAVTGGGGGHVIGLPLPRLPVCHRFRSSAPCSYRPFADCSGSSRVEGTRAARGCARHPVSSSRSKRVTSSVT